ncbi:MAG: hypothetical protein NZ703_13285 [Gemmataceae bacterium]|nr:hypothetical protein [Gemmataceae bacterium]
MTQRSACLLVLSVVGVAGLTGTVQAGWDNVFQVCCFGCDRPRVSYAVPCPPPCPPPEVRVSYIQRTYYQPVTEYVRRTYYEPVTQNVVSYYYEPITEYRYTTYYDPCTGCPIRVCQPTTSYRLRSQCNTVTSYVERTALVPVTSYRPVTVQQPVVSYYYPPTSVSYGAPLVPAPPPAIPPAAPSIQELRDQVPGTMPPSSSNDKIPPPNVPTQPGMSYPRPAYPVQPRPERTASRPRTTTVTVRGEVVLNDQITPRSGARLVFVNADNLQQREYVTANAFGEFDLSLPVGRWYLYLGGDEGRALYHKAIHLTGEREVVEYKVVSR